MITVEFLAVHCAWPQSSSTLLLNGSNNCSQKKKLLVEVVMGERQSSSGKILATQVFLAQPALPDVRHRLFSSSSMWYHSFNSRNWHNGLRPPKIVNYNTV